MDRTSKTYISSLRFLGQLVTLCIVAILVAVSSAHAAESGRAKRVLMLFSGSKFAPGSALVEQSVQDMLQKGPQALEFYAEYLDASRFPEENHYQLFHFRRVCSDRSCCRIRGSVASSLGTNRHTRLGWSFRGS